MRPNNDIRNNHAQYPGIHDYFRTHRPAMLVVSGEKDPIFPAANQRAISAVAPAARLPGVFGAEVNFN